MHKPATMHSLSLRGKEESILWLGLALLYFSFHDTSMFTGILFVSSVLFSSLNQRQQPNLWRTPSSTVERDLHGIIMSAVLIPLVLLVMQQPTYALLLVVSSLDVPILVLVLGAACFGQIQTHEMYFYVLYFTLIRYSPIKVCESMQGVLTMGEFNLVSTLGGILGMEGFRWIPETEQDIYLSVAGTGVTGCLLGCFVATRLPPSLVIRLPILVGFPLVVVESNLYRLSTHQSSMPLCIYWLIDFLTQLEGPFPRYYFLVYWTLLLVILLPLSPISVTSTVVARKWFHFIAIMLFTPPTYYAPKLMALSYAIALCVLMVIEHCRNFLPVQDFYVRYLDIDKDTADKVIISQMTLIVGCAIPCWMAALTMDTTTALPFFGILVLGIGDSMAAIVGTYYGRTKWGRHRSVEGSLAMWFSMMVVGSFVSEMNGCFLAAVTFTTFIEAFTCQIDNLVLPLAGATLLLLMQYGRVPE